MDGIPSTPGGRAMNALHYKLYHSLTPSNREIIDRGRLGREMGRLSIEDGVALTAPSDAVQMVRDAFFKAYPKERAQELLSMMGKEQ